MKKFEKGITLIALIITIIVMLILVSASIHLAIKNNIFGQAKQAVDETNSAQQEEHKISTGQITMDDEETDLNDFYESLSGTNCDGSWNDLQFVNSPKLTEDMQGIYFNDNYEPILVTEENITEWYDYDSGRWAYAKTSDNQLWVWIPRYAYKITSGLGTNNDKNISVKFLQGKTNKDLLDNIISTEYPTVINDAMTDYVVHPAFTNGKSNNFANGEWDSELQGFWVSVDSPTSNTIENAYTFSQNYNKSKNSHLMKNSEFGAVFYLQNSSYKNSYEIPVLSNNVWTACVVDNLGTITAPLDFINPSPTLKCTKYFSIFSGQETFGDSIFETSSVDPSTFTSVNGYWFKRMLYDDTYDFASQNQTKLPFHIILCID